MLKWLGKGLADWFNYSAGPIPRILIKFDEKMAKWSQGLEQRLSMDAMENYRVYEGITCDRASLQVEDIRWNMLHKSFFKKIPGWPIREVRVNDEVHSRGYAEEFVNLEILPLFAALPGYQKLEQSVADAGLILECKTVLGVREPCIGPLDYYPVLSFRITTPSGQPFEKHFQTRRASPGPTPQ
jgi:hypothetical protein